MAKKPSHKLVLRVVFSSLLGIFLIILWAHFVNFSYLFARLKTADLQLASLFFVLFVVSGTGRGFRLKTLLKKYSLPFKNIVMLTFLGQFLSFFIPVRAGEITKSAYLTSRYDLPLGKTITWIFIDRFLDFLAVLFFIAWLIFLVPNRLSKDTPLIAAGLFAVFLLFFIAAVLAQSVLKKVLMFASRFLVFPKIKKGFLSFSTHIVDGFEVLRQGWGILVVVIGLTVFVTLSDSLMWFFVFRSVGVSVNFETGLFGNCLTALTFLIPSTPGYIGSAEAAATGVFAAVLGVNINAASAGAVLMHLMTALALLAAGLSAIYLLDFDLGTVWTKIRGQ